MSPVNRISQYLVISFGLFAPCVCQDTVRVSVIVLDAHFLPFGKFCCELKREAGNPFSDSA